MTGEQKTKVISGTATVEESIAGGAVSKSIMGATEDKLEKTITGDITETITVTGKIAANITAAVEFNEIITAPIIKQTRTGNSDWLKSAESQLVLGMCSDSYGGIKQSNFTGLLQENFIGGKINSNKSFEVVNGKLKTDKQQTVINQYKTTVITKTKINVINAKITMVG